MSPRAIALVLLLQAVLVGVSPQVAVADRALPTWEAYRAQREIDISAEAWARGEVLAAEAAAARAVLLAPGRVEGWRVLALSRLALGRHAAAAETSGPLAELAGDDLDSCLLRGRIAVEVGDSVAARAVFEHATRLAPEDARPILGQALVAARLDHDMAQMSALLRRARGVDASEPDATLPLQSAWAPLADDPAFLSALRAVLEDGARSGD